MRRNRPGLTMDETRRVEWKEYLEEFEAKHPYVLYIVDLFEVEL